MKTRKLFFTALVIVAMYGCKKEDKSTPATPSTPAPAASEYVMTINDGSGTITMQEGVGSFFNTSYLSYGYGVPAEYIHEFIFEDSSGVNKMRGEIQFRKNFTLTPSNTELDAMYKPGTYTSFVPATIDSTITIQYTESNNITWYSETVPTVNQSGNITVTSVEAITDIYLRNKVKGTFTCKVASTVGGTTKTISGSFTTKLGVK